MSLLPFHIRIPEQRKLLEDAFEAADKNGDGILSADEYLEIFQSHGLTIGKVKLTFKFQEF